MYDEGVELYIARGAEVQCNLGGGVGGRPYFQIWKL